MNATLQRFKLLSLILSLGWTGAFFTSCDDDEKTKTVPNVTTGTVTEITGTSAIVAGEIVDDGNTAGIIASGFVYSSTNAEPTLADSKTEETATDGEYTSELEGLTSSTTYHVRAYAINSVGAGFGEVVDFTTGNAAPVVSGVEITGTIQANMEVKASYIYADAESDVQSGTTFQWYRANDGAKAGAAPIAGATSVTYTIQDADESKYIWVVVIPKAATGTTTGEEVESALKGPVGQATTVTFMYNGVEVTYGILNSTKTGKRWMDRNLGAPNAPTGENDWANFGDVFQWGRTADGHQLVNRTEDPFANTGVNGTTTTLSTTNTPVDNKFILTSAEPNDWRNPQNGNLWQAPDYINNPCPQGWHIPTQAEWLAEELALGSSETVIDAYNKLKITRGGNREYSFDFFGGFGSLGSYWSSTVDTSIPAMSKGIVFWDGSPEQPTADYRAKGMMCRCVKN
jgi:uncharacterized protein (TIGR02145 family)